MSSPSSIFKPGDLLSNSFRVEAVLGRGGTSEVYRVRSEVARKASESRFALKVLRVEFSDNETLHELMMREAEVREIHHDAIVRYFPAQRLDSGQIFLVMEFVDGPSLERRMRDGSLPAEDLLVLAERVVGGLQAAHAKNIVHRDLSPDNIILRGGDPAEAVIIDFGIAKDTNPGAQTIVGTDFAGKYAYAAPEQLAGQTDQRSDVYSLGAVLLAAWRGQAPKPGTNLLEIARAKGEPLDTQGVPEPLKSLVERMTEPDREKRLQNAGEVIAAIRAARAGGGPGEAPAHEATVIVPQGRPPVVAAPLPSPPPPPAARKRGPGRVIALLAVVLLMAGAAAWLAGLIAERRPVAAPYTLVVERPAAAPPRASGYVPSEAVRAGLGERLDAAGGAAEVTLARGEIVDSWGADVLSLVDAVSGLDEWRIAVSDNQVQITGLTEDRALRDRLTTELAGAALTGEVEIELGPRLLDPMALRPILEAHEDCGALWLVDPPAAGYPQGEGIVIDGRIAQADTGAALASAVAGVAGDREVEVVAHTLNPTLCLVDAALPVVPPGGFEFSFVEGTTGLPNPEGRFVVGDRPVIEVVIPADVTDGYLYVSVLDVAGSVFHLLPNQFRPDNAITTLREGKEGPVTVRLTCTPAETEAAGGRRIALEIRADTPFGDSRLVAIHSPEPLFAGMRPIEESAGGFVQLLGEIEAPVTSLDSRILTTAER